ncbi:MAG: hypothetical protein ABIK26_01720 [Candidatus Omnitrophota bacterium]
MDKELRPIDILLVDDNDDDILIIQRAFKKVRFTNVFHVTRSGEEAFDFIQHRGTFNRGQS